MEERIGLSYLLVILLSKRGYSEKQKAYQEDIQHFLF